jgi:hypothetical protein
MNDELEILKWSNPSIAQANAYKYLGDDAKIYFSKRKGKKFKIFNPNTQKYVHFGALGYQDHTRDPDPRKKASYLARATNIKGQWINDPYSPNNLSIHILWS